jgi:hypothetical protein
MIPQKPGEDYIDHQRPRQVGRRKAMKHDNDNVGRNLSSNSQITRQLREFWHNLVDETVAALQQGRQPQPLLQPVRVIARARDRNRPPQRY